VVTLDTGDSAILEVQLVLEDHVSHGGREADLRWDAAIVRSWLRPVGVSGIRSGLNRRGRRRGGNIAVREGTSAQEQKRERRGEQLAVHDCLFDP
jgi:hypothetical protein